MCPKCKVQAYCNDGCAKSHSTSHALLCAVIVKNHRISIIRDDAATKFYEEYGVPDPRLRTPADIKPPKAGDQFYVKIQTVEMNIDPQQMLRLYDASRTVHVCFRDPAVYELVLKYGVLGVNQFTSKKIFCRAELKSDGTVVLHTDDLALPQEW